MEHDLSGEMNNNPGFVEQPSEFGACTGAVKLDYLSNKRIKPADSFTGIHNGPSVALQPQCDIQETEGVYHYGDLSFQSAGRLYILTSDIFQRIRDYIGGLCEGLETLALVSRKVGRWFCPDVGIYFS